MRIRKDIISQSAVHAGVLLIFAMLPLPCLSSPLGEDAFDTISISADEAREDEESAILYFNGHFVMLSSEWRLTSEQATVYGRLDTPEKVSLQGTPARFSISKSDDHLWGPVEASAPIVEYLRSANTLSLSGGAILKLGDEVIRSKTIEFDITTDQYRASGTGGVLIEVPVLKIR
jgi:lipopolysaccharide transport protein LptA